ncbi:MAG: DUF721 domain-containing protein [Cycloclasticus sp.]|nr:DUF721 domain-containing protein [Cycloclasticus sp.]MBQ0790539.1 DUF721 domain-containing protein [Cycloclasticus sp.]
MLKKLFNHRLSSSDALLQIQQRLNLHDKTLKAVKTNLDDQLANHCLHIIVNKEVAILFTDSSIWASKLLYMRAPILQTLSDYTGSRIASLKVKVLTYNPTDHKKAPQTPSSKTLSALSSTNNTSSNDKLSTSMKKLIHVLKRNRLLD